MNDRTRKNYGMLFFYTIVMILIKEGWKSIFYFLVNSTLQFSVSIVVGNCGYFFLITIK
ncbi:hypothetical protein M2372_003575 [Chryseobacterium sp. BIGb0232]|nr:hypothetical protein [Chryseobacterium sp. BIGb0232]ROS17688.1 hypothetical protein EDF65_2069 [Chryseobacterium nakagawai]